MRICVIGAEPIVFYLGARRLPVVAVLSRWLDGAHCCYEVSVEDGRRFVLRHERQTGQWELAAVYRAGPVATRAPARTRSPA